MSLEVNLSSNSCEDVLVAVKTIRVKMSGPGERSVEEVHTIPDRLQKKRKTQVTVKIPKAFPEPEKIQPVPTFRPAHLSMQEGWQMNARQSSQKEWEHCAQDQWPAPWSLGTTKRHSTPKKSKAKKADTDTDDEIQLTPKSQLSQNDHMCLDHLEEKMEEVKEEQRFMVDKILSKETELEERMSTVKELEKKEREIFVLFKLIDKVRGTKIPREMKTADQLVRAYGNLQQLMENRARRREMKKSVRNMFAVPPLDQGQ